MDWVCRGTLRFCLTAPVLRRPPVPPAGAAPWRRGAAAGKPADPIRTGFAALTAEGLRFDVRMLTAKGEMLLLGPTAFCALHRDVILIRLHGGKKKKKPKCVPLSLFLPPTRCL